MGGPEQAAHTARMRIDPIPRPRRVAPTPRVITCAPGARRVRVGEGANGAREERARAAKRHTHDESLVRICALPFLGARRVGRDGLEPTADRAEHRAVGIGGKGEQAG